MFKLVEDQLLKLAKLCRRYDVRRLDLFGSAAKGAMTVTSDLDFLVEFNNYTPQNAADRFFGLQMDLEELFARQVDLVSSKSIRNPYFRAAVERERVLLYAA